jgi:predicted enzyme related to lactoylglutathione lyase
VACFRGLMFKKSAPGVFYGPMLVCGDFRRTFEFYHRTLGLETEVDGSPPWAEFQSKSVRLVLLVHGATAPPRANATGGAAVLAVQMEDVDSVHARLVKAGVSFESPPTDRPMMGLRSALLRDPEGNLVEITTQLRKAAER